MTKLLQENNMDRVISESASVPSISTDELDEMIRTADQAKLKAYAPYSKFRVGAALLDTNGKIFPGTNVENSSYGMTVCAERTAVFRAVTEGSLSFRAIVVTTDISESVVYPCGACRQVMSEFGNLDIYCLRPNGKVTRTTLEDLMPMAFSSTQLNQGQVDIEDE